MRSGFYNRLPDVVLASGSPRRAYLLQQMGISFLQERSDIDESLAVRGVSVHALPEWLARSKAEAVAIRHGDKLVIGADTVVLLDGAALHRPREQEEACGLLRRLSGREHVVLTGVCLAYRGGIESFTVSTDVCFRQLSDEEIDYYVQTFAPYDKAGGYGIQEWIGLVGVSWIRGAYTNVMGLPTEALSERLAHYIL